MTTPAATVGDHEILTGTHAWRATPEDYSSLRDPTFEKAGSGAALYGYGQTIYAKVAFDFDLSDGLALRLRYRTSPALGSFRGFEPAADTAEKLIPYMLVDSEYRGVESVVAFQFRCDWLLTLADSPWPIGMTFPRPIPTQFYGHCSRWKHPTK